MKNLFKYVFLLVMVVIGTVPFTSCGDSNDDGSSNGDGGGNTLSITTLQNSSWYRAWTDYDNSFVGNYTDRFYFVTDSKGMMHWTEKTVDETDGEQSSRGDRYFSYVVSGNYVTITWEDDKSSDQYVYINGSLKNSYGDILSPMNLTSDDKTYIAEIESNINKVYASVVGKTYRCDVRTEYAYYSITFTSATECTLKSDEIVEEGLFSAITAKGTYTMESGKIFIKGVYPTAGGKFGEFKTGSNKSFELFPTDFTNTYQDEYGNQWLLQ